MNNELMRYHELLPTYFDDDFQNAKSTLISHMKNKEYFLHDRQVIYNNVTIEVNYSTKNLNQANFIDCTFNNCNFESTSFVNSTFIRCKFLACNLKSTNFRGSVFENVSFDGNTVLSATKCGNCKFSECDFDSCTLDSVVLDEATLYNCSFINSTWYALSLDLCLFKNTSFEDIKFKNMNFEFSIFDNIHMNNMKLPFPTIPYIYGAFQYLQTTDDNVCITSQHDVKKGISKEAYLTLLDELEKYYAFTNNYFPLANIYLAKKDIDKCKSSIIFGMEKAVAIHNLRLLEDLARLISFNSLFSVSERYTLLNHIVSKISAEHYTIETTNKINKCIFNLRTLLFKPVNQCSSFHMSIKTDIDNNERQLASFICALEKVINSIDAKKDYNIEMKHNSPYEFFINFFSDYESICCVLSALILTLKGTDKFLNKVFDYINSIQTIKKQRLENQILEQEIKLNELKIQKKKHDLQECKDKAIQSQEYIKKQNIKVGNVSYIIINDNSNTVIQSSDIIY